MAAQACAHVFHAYCIEPWLHSRGSCPVCQCTDNPTSILIPDPASTSTSIGECPVCLEALRLDCGDVRAAHACGHVFHSHCIEPWLNQQGSCPVCRCTVSFNPNSTYNPASISTSNPTPDTNPTSIPTPNSTSNSGPVGECPVCLEPLCIGGGDMRAAHACGHVFHSRCIERWRGDGARNQ
ncbi:Uncharacterized RING finger protein P32A8.03c [Triticum urartu]|uniref:RING-type E3 ubiquitin transferase n=2 Tax=Triticum urartu TaxID=4572 RepID=M7ZBZ3_TRIUA|nr:Uncharacterized RING finger protein P32A8.03c [Triticum urartu]